MLKAYTHLFYQELEKRRHFDSDLILAKKQPPDRKELQTIIQTIINRGERQQAALQLYDTCFTITLRRWNVFMMDLQESAYL